MVDLLNKQRVNGLLILLIVIIINVQNQEQLCKYRQNVLSNSGRERESEESEESIGDFSGDYLECLDSSWLAEEQVQQLKNTFPMRVEEVILMSQQQLDHLQSHSHFHTLGTHSLFIYVRFNALQNHYRVFTYFCTFFSQFLKYLLQLRFYFHSYMYLRFYQFLYYYFRNIHNRHINFICSKLFTHLSLCLVSLFCSCLSIQTIDSKLSYDYILLPKVSQKKNIVK